MHFIVKINKKDCDEATLEFLEGSLTRLIRSAPVQRDCAIGVFHEKTIVRMGEYIELSSGS